MSQCKCGTTIGLPGPPQVKLKKKGKPLDDKSTFVHDMPGVVEMVLAIICPNCFHISHFATDVAAMRELVNNCEVVEPEKPS